jgi:cell division protein FtsI (penicillin-binding protein 3)
VAARLVYVQGIAYADLARYGRSELVHLIHVPSARGTIYDRFGRPLAYSVPAPTIVADPLLVKDPARVAEALSPVLNEPKDRIASLLSQRTGFVYLLRQTDWSTAKRVRSLGLPGISEIEEEKRVYVDGGILSSILGTVDIDGKGISGIELMLNDVLAGKSGEAVVDKAPDGMDLPGSLHYVEPPRPGKGVLLSIDLDLQYFLSMALANGVLADGATAGWGAIEDPRNGQILAMASVIRVSPCPATTPRVLAAAAGACAIASSVNYPALYTFEPGSVMKVATMAGALELHLVSPSTVINVPASLPLGGYVFHDAEPHGDERLSVAQVLAQSSNIGTIEVAAMLGPKRLYQYLRALGFGETSGVGFPGESSGLVANWKSWSVSTMGSMPIGQAAAVTSLQILRAYSTIADSGCYVAPSLVAGFVGQEGRVSPRPPAPPVRVVGSSTDAQLVGMLNAVVDVGTGTAAQIPGYTVAGKTGTAQIPALGGGYIPGAYMATFVGFVPAERPALAGVITLERPKVIFGGATAAPIFSQVMKFALQRYHVPPSQPAAAGRGQSA